MKTSAEPLKAKIGFDFFSFATSELIDEVLNRLNLKFMKETNDYK
jgi:hypothetical protein